MRFDFSRIASRFPGLWVVLADDKTVLGSGKTAEAALKKAQKQGHETLIITHVPEEDEIPNDDLLHSIEEAKREEREGTLKSYSTVKEFMASLED